MEIIKKTYILSVLPTVDPADYERIKEFVRQLEADASEEFREKTVEMLFDNSHIAYSSKKFEHFKYKEALPDCLSLKEIDNLIDVSLYGLNDETYPLLVKALGGDKKSAMEFCKQFAKGLGGIL